MTEFYAPRGGQLMMKVSVCIKLYNRVSILKIYLITQVLYYTMNLI